MGFDACDLKFPLFAKQKEGLGVFSQSKLDFLINLRSFEFRKEVIHPQLRLGIPCYDLSLIANFRLSRLNRDSSTTDFAALTGGVYKTRERIHRGLLIRDYYQFRLHEGGFQPSI